MVWDGRSARASRTLHTTVWMSKLALRFEGWISNNLLPLGLLGSAQICKTWVYV